MNKKILFALSFVFALIGFSSCSENVAEEEYENWRPRNEHFIDSIASLARSGKDGWEMIKSYNLSDSLGKNGQNIYYIYVQKLEKGTGETYPEYNDSIPTVGKWLSLTIWDMAQVAIKKYLVTPLLSSILSWQESINTR